MTDLTNLLKTLDDATADAKREKEIIQHMLLHARVAVNRQHQIVSSLKVVEGKLDADLRLAEDMAKQAQLDLEMAIHNKAHCRCREENCPHMSRIPIARFHRDIKRHSVKYCTICKNINQVKLTAAEKKDQEVNIMFALLTHFSGYILFLDNGMYFEECVQSAQDIVKLVNDVSNHPTVAETMAQLFGQSRLKP